MRWAGLVAHIENVYRILVRKQEHLEDLDTDGRIIVFLQQGCILESFCSEQGKCVGSL
jgi:hypothetical protein